MRFALFAVFLLVLAGCAQLTPDEQDFKTVCEAHKHAFMKMEPMMEGQALGPPCFGCMPDIKTHICDKNEYLKYVAKE
jgi:hypothetical protein